MLVLVPQPFTIEFALELLEVGASVLEEVPEAFDVELLFRPFRRGRPLRGCCGRGSPSERPSEGRAMLLLGALLGPAHERVLDGVGLEFVEGDALVEESFGERLLVVQGEELGRLGGVLEACFELFGVDLIWVPDLRRGLDDGLGLERRCHHFLGGLGLGPLGKRRRDLLGAELRLVEQGVLEVDRLAEDRCRVLERSLDLLVPFVRVAPGSRTIRRTLLQRAACGSQPCAWILSPAPSLAP